MAQGFLLFFLCGPLSHIHLRINISQRVKVITSTNTWYHRSAKEHIPLKFQLYSSFKTQHRNDCTKSGSRVLTFPYSQCASGVAFTTPECASASLVNVRVVWLLYNSGMCEWWLRQCASGRDFTTPECAIASLVNVREVWS